MPTDAPFTPPKKKPSVFWWIGGAFLVLMLLFLLQLLGPSPRIIVSAQTTHITEPLRADGLPDYEKFVLERSREGVTPENNAATLLWPALWPGELDPPQYAAVAAELGLDAVPSKADAVVPVYNRIDDWLKSQQPAGAGPSETPPNNDPQQSDAIFDQVTSRPWTTKEFPILAKWASDNQKPLDKMVAASRRPRCYFPSPQLINKPYDMLMSFLLPGVQGAREAGRSLVLRAMWQVGEKRPMEAWKDLLAIERLGRLTAQGPTMVEELVGIALAGTGDKGTATMLHESQLSADEARQVLRDLESLERFSSMADSMDNMERLGFLDAVIAMSRGDADPEMMSMIGADESVSYIRHVRIDWNIVLRKGNAWYDRYVAAARLPTYEARQQAFSQIDQDIQQLRRQLGVNTLLASIVNPTARSEAVAAVMISMFMPSTNAAIAAEERANASLDLTRMTAALAVYRAEHGNYPEKLDDLVPGVFAKLPLDHYHAKPFIYDRIDDGYLLYTAGPNGQDDGGSNEQMSVSEGDALNELDEAESETAREKIPAGADDLAIRVPRPPLKDPQSAEPSETQDR